MNSQIEPTADTQSIHKQNDVVVSVRNISKKFCRNLRRSMLYGIKDLSQNLLGMKSDTTMLRKDEFWALENVSFEVKSGEKVGFLGTNGAGKSTLLRLLNGIFPPDKGEILIQGKVGSLIALGAGFHPHMTGRENVYLNGIILGMTHDEINEKFDAIVTFSEIGSFIDAPVSTYSSGMTVRLGFSIAIHSDVDIMLVDEVLAVGDMKFALKCMRKLSEYRQKGGTFILVSHNMQMIRNTCERVIWLDKGEIRTEGTVNEICDLYEAEQLKIFYADEHHKPDKGLNIINLDHDVVLTNVAFFDQSNTPTDTFQVGKPFIVKIRYCANRPVLHPIFTVILTDAEGRVLFENYSNLDMGQQYECISGQGEIQFKIERLPVRPNIYYCSIMLSEKELLNKLEWHEKMYRIIVTNNIHYPINNGLIYPEPQWYIRAAEE